MPTPTTETSIAISLQEILFLETERQRDEERTRMLAAQRREAELVARREDEAQRAKLADEARERERQQALLVESRIRAAYDLERERLLAIDASAAKAREAAVRATAQTSTIPSGALPASTTPVVNKGPRIGIALTIVATTLAGTLLFLREKKLEDALSSRERAIATLEDRLRLTEKKPLPVPDPLPKGAGPAEPQPKTSSEETSLSRLPSAPSPKPRPNPRPAKEVCHAGDPMCGELSLH